MYNRLLTSFVAGSVSGLLSLSVFAADLDWGIETAIGHTDNATRVSSNEVSDTIGSVGGHIDFTREGSRVDGRLRGVGSFRNYFDNTYSDDFLGSGIAELRIGLIGESVTWSVDDTFGQVLSDVFAPSTPDNRENVNIFSTGPDMRLHLGRSTEIVVAGRYQESNYQNSSSVDSQRVSGDISLVRHTSPAVAWSLNVSASNVDYDGTGNPGYDQQEVFVRLESRGANQTLTADAGVGFLDGGNQTDQTALVRINWTRQLSSSWSLDLGAITEFANADDQFVYGVGGGTELGGTQDVKLSGQAMRSDNGTLALRFVRPRTRLRFFGDIGKETYPDTDGQDRSRWSLGVEATRRLTAHLEATLLFSHEDRDFDASAGNDKTDYYSARLDWRIGRSLHLGIEGRKENRSGNTSYSYDETIYLASLSYRTGAQ
ncbi:MAG: hypothetical protein WAU48_09510 [Gammaproteobacteria bacterium]